MRKDKETWDQHSKLVLGGLEKLDERLDGLEKSQTQILIEIATLKAKSAMWGAAAGIAPTLLMWFFDHRK